jgi:hypothetical protein
VQTDINLYMILRMVCVFITLYTDGDISYRSVGFIMKVVGTSDLIQYIEFNSLHFLFSLPRARLQYLKVNPYVQGGPKVDIQYVVYSIITVYLLLAHSV